jgi:hypothetical protein
MPASATFPGIYGIVPFSYQPTIFNQADGLMF